MKFQDDENIPNGGNISNPKILYEPDVSDGVSVLAVRVSGLVKLIVEEQVALVLGQPALHINTSHHDGRNSGYTSGEQIAVRIHTLHIEASKKFARREFATKCLVVAEPSPRNTIETQNAIERVFLCDDNEFRIDKRNVLWLTNL